VIWAIVVTFRLSTEVIVTLAKKGGVFGLACLIELELRRETLPLLPPFLALLARFLSESSAFVFTIPQAIAAKLPRRLPRQRPQALVGASSVCHPTLWSTLKIEGAN
jgi:hypothetical protein